MRALTRTPWRPLHAVLMSSPKNLARLDEIKKWIKEDLSLSMNTSDSVAVELINNLPAIAWMHIRFMEMKPRVQMLRLQLFIIHCHRG